MLFTEHEDFFDVTKGLHESISIKRKFKVQSIIFYIKLQLMTLTTMWKLDDALYFCTSLDWFRFTLGRIQARQLLPAEWKITAAPVYCQIFCTQPAICYVVNTDFFLCSKGKLIAKRDENLFSYWLGNAECQDGGGQLWGKAGRPTTFCLSHA